MIEFGGTSAWSTSEARKSNKETNKRKEGKKMKGLKKLVGEINRNHDLNVNIITDGSEVWGDFFSDGNSWNQYHDKTIKCVGKVRNEPFRGGKITMAQIMEMLENN
jgi:hypothetical protein